MFDVCRISCSSEGNGELHILSYLIIHYTRLLVLKSECTVWEVNTSHEQIWIGSIQGLYEPISVSFLYIENRVFLSKSQLNMLYNIHYKREIL